MNNQASFEEKVSFIKENYPDYEKVDPYSDLDAVTEIKNLLVEGGFTKLPAYRIEDTVIIRLINAAQKKYVPKRFVSAHGRTYSYKRSGSRKAV